MAAAMAAPLLSACGGRNSANPDPEAGASWDSILEQARGQNVYWNAWAGDARTNAYISWVARQVKTQFDITLSHVKLQDTGEAVSRILAEKSAGRTTGGSVDLLWINGENFAALKSNAMLYGPFVDRIPASQNIDYANEPAFTEDFTIPVEGMEIPWGKSEFVFSYDRARIANPPRSFSDIAAWARTHPGRFTYPAPPDFTGSSFLKQALITLAPANADFSLEPDARAFVATAAPLLAYLADLHPHMWRSGRTQPQSGPALRQLLADGEVDISMSFNPTETAGAIALGQLPASVRIFGLTSGSLSNAHFLAIPANSGAKAGAMTVINFLLSPQAQARKADIKIWGDASVLDTQRLTAKENAMFNLDGASVDDQDFGPSLSEPHPAWMEMLETAWAKTYAQ